MSRAAVPNSRARAEDVVLDLAPFLPSRHTLDRSGENALATVENQR